MCGSHRFRDSPQPAVCLNKVVSISTTPFPHSSCFIGSSNRDHAQYLHPPTPRGRLHQSSDSRQSPELPAVVDTGQTLSYDARQCIDPPKPGDAFFGQEKDGRLDWPDALAWAEKLKLTGHEDWRLPTAKELQSLLDDTRSPDTTKSAAIDPVFASTPIKNGGSAATRKPAIRRASRRVAARREM